MFLKVILTFLAVGALSVSALTIPVARSPAPEPDFQDVMARDEFEARELAARSLGFLAEKREPKGKPKGKPKPNNSEQAGLVKGDPSRGVSDRLVTASNAPCLQRGNC